jgi:hypothetical protein
MTLNSAPPKRWRGNGIAERITGKGEAMAILEQCKEAGLAQTGDNVQRKESPTSATAVAAAAA